MFQFDSNYTMTIGGKAVATERTFPAFNPATRKTIAQVPDGTVHQLNDAVSAARSAFREWRETPLARRQEAVRGIGEALERTPRTSCGCSPGSRASPAPARSGRSSARSSGCREIATTVPARRDRRGHRRPPGGHAFHAARRRRRYRSVEFPGAARDLEDRAGAGDRQHDRHQTLAVHAALHAQARRALPRPAAARRAQRR